MLIASAIARDAASVPLAVFGGLWFVLGLGGIWTEARQVREIVIDGERVEFRFAGRTIVIPSAQIYKIDRPWWDTNAMGRLRFRTRTHGIIKAPPRLRGFVEFAIELRRANPDVVLGTL